MLTIPTNSNKIFKQIDIIGNMVYMQHSCSSNRYGIYITIYTISGSTMQIVAEDILLYSYDYTGSSPLIFFQCINDMPYILKNDKESFIGTTL
jgi:hypothetical protein